MVTTKNGVTVATINRTKHVHTREQLQFPLRYANKREAFFYIVCFDLRCHILCLIFVSLLVSFLRSNSNINNITIQSVGAQFKNQLNSLLGAIGETHPHYVRCLKPNDENVRSQFDLGRITAQLANGGMLGY